MLECGTVSNADPGKRWVNVRRADDIVRFPTSEYLTETLLGKYAVRAMGPSVPQKGDPIPREVYHCSLRKPTVGVIRGAAKSGKSSLAGLLQGKNINVVKSDAFFSGYIKTGNFQEYAPQTPLYEMLAAEINYLNMQKIPQRIKDLDAVDEFCNDFIATLPLDEPLVIVEGEVFAHDFIFERFPFFLKKNNAIVWDISRK